MGDHWSYEKQRRKDHKGRRWHFVRRYIDNESLSYDERPFELYFRDDDRTEFGVLRFDKTKDNPYRNYEGIVNKIMNDASFRRGLLNEETERIWLRTWK